MKYFVLISESTILPKPAEEVSDILEDTLSDEKPEQNEVLQDTDETKEPEDIEDPEEDENTPVDDLIDDANDIIWKDFWDEEDEGGDA